MPDEGFFILIQNMSKHKKQHFIPACYLKAWCDPLTPDNQTPYVWMFSKDGSIAKNKSPEKIFTETDIYTIKSSDGKRDLVFEHGLNQLETEFVKIRRTKLGKLSSLDVVEHMKICAFVGAMKVRTPAMRDHHKKQWGEALEMMEDMKEWAQTATVEEKIQASSISSGGSGKGFNYEQVKSMHENPLQETLLPMIGTMAHLLSKQDFAILYTSDKPGFITSDEPCVWYDPEAYKRPPMFRSPGLWSKTLEIILPISPEQCLLLNRFGMKGYIPAPQLLVDELNKRVINYSKNHFIVRSKTKKEAWFKVDPEPEDSWEKMQKKRTS